MKMRRAKINSDVTALATSRILRFTLFASSGKKTMFSIMKLTQQAYQELEIPTLGYTAQINGKPCTSITNFDYLPVYKTV